MLINYNCCTNTRLAYNSKNKVTLRSLPPFLVRFYFLNLCWCLFILKSNQCVLQNESFSVMPQLGPPHTQTMQKVFQTSHSCTSFYKIHKFFAILHCLFCKMHSIFCKRNNAFCKMCSMFYKMISTLCKMISFCKML